MGCYVSSVTINIHFCDTIYELQYIYIVIEHRENITYKAFDTFQMH